jgi:serine/threonine protein kinase
VSTVSGENDVERRADSEDPGLSDTLTATGSSACPDDTALSTLLAGTLAPRDRAHLLQHIEGCPACQDLAVVAMQALGSGSLGSASLGRGSLSYGSLGYGSLGFGSLGRGSSLAVNFRPGSIVGERYRIEHFIARGGMGEVYRAFDRELGEWVALKTVRSTASDNVRAQQHLKAEVQLARRISHPNICRIYDFGRHVLGGGPECVHFLSMEFIEGESLGQRLRRAPLPVATAQQIARQLLLGLAAAHAAGVLHRDFKSENVMLRSEGSETARAVIMDFGLARALDTGEALHQSDADKLVGSVAYMAPEQVVGENLGPPADIYAFGVVFFEMLTQRLPFEGESPLAVALKRLNGTVLPPSKAYPPLGTTWDSVVLRCLQRDPARRYASAVDALADFDRVLARPEALSTARRGVPSLVWAGLAVLLAVVLVVAAVTQSLRTGSAQLQSLSALSSATAQAALLEPPVRRSSPAPFSAPALPAPLPAALPAPALPPPSRAQVESLRTSVPRSAKRAPSRPASPAAVKRSDSATPPPVSPSTASAEPKSELSLDRDDPWVAP